jgi:hypothetical protein
MKSTKKTKGMKSTKKKKKTKGRQGAAAIENGIVFLLKANEKKQLHGNWNIWSIAFNR